MLTIFDGLLWVHYGQAYVLSNGSHSDAMPACFRGQRNGLVGAALRGFLFLITGLHTGNVRFRVLVHEKRPIMDETWEECVEVSFTPVGSTTRVADWNGSTVCMLDLRPSSYRVRYSARGMDEARKQDALLDNQEPIDEYLLEFWQEASAPDQVIRQTSGIAAYWHEAAPRMAPSEASRTPIEGVRQPEPAAVPMREPVALRAAGIATTPGTPSDTVKRSTALLRILDPLRAALRQIPGCNSSGIGLTVAAFERLQSSGGGPEDVSPEDLVITIGFETEEYLEAGRAQLADALRDAPYECRVIGRIVAL